MNFISVLLCVLLLTSATYFLVFPTKSLFNDIFNNRRIDNDNDQNDNIMINGLHDFIITQDQCTQHVSTANAILSDDEWKKPFIATGKRDPLKNVTEKHQEVLEVVVSVMEMMQKEEDC